MINMELTNVSKIYKVDEVTVTALDNVSLKIENGDFISIVGPSGSGKSTLMHILGLLDKPTSGVVKLDGEEVSFKNDVKLASLRNKKIGFVFQSFNLLPRTTALANVELPLIYGGVSAKERHERSKEVLESVGLGQRTHHFPNQMSGGSIVLADEPTGNLDSKSGEEIMSIFKDLHKKGNTIVLVTHDLDIAGMTKKIIRVKDGKIVRE